MSEIDAAELATLRDMAKEMLDVDPSQFEAVVSFEPSVVISLIDALEKARGDVSTAWQAVRVRDETINVTVKKRIAERDSARALLREAQPLLVRSDVEIFLRPRKSVAIALRARISAELEPKP